MRHVTLTAVLAALLACVPGRVAVIPAGTLSLAPRPRSCSIEFYRVKQPERPFDLAFGSMIGVAVSFRGEREKHRMEAALRRTAQAEFDEKLAEERKRVPGVPAGFVPARVREGTTLYALPERRADVVAYLGAGTETWVSPKPSSGWRRAFVPGGEAGWVEDAQVELRGPAAPNLPAASEPPRGTSI